jgi:putative oxidoreductase
MFRKLLKTGNHNSATSFALLIFRVGISLMMLTHGYPKFQKILDGNFKFSDPLGLGSEVSLVLVVLAEFVCSLLLSLGLVSRLALMPLITAMSVALFIAHGDDPFSTQEKSAMYLLSFLFLLITGPGKYSVDRKLFG